MSKKDSIKLKASNINQDLFTYSQRIKQHAKLNKNSISPNSSEFLKTSEGSQTPINLLFSVEKKAYQLHSTLYRFLWPFAIKWNSDYTKLQWNTKPFFKPFFSYLSYIITIIYGLAALTIALGSDHVFPEQKFKIFNRVILIIVFLLIVALLVAAWYMGTKEIQQSYVATMVCIHRFENDLPPAKKQSIQPGKNYFLFFSFIPGLLFLPLGCSLGNLMAGLDPSHFILEHYLSNPMYRSLNEIYFSWAVKLLIVLWVTLEASRTGSFCLICLVVYLNRFSRFARRLLGREGSPNMVSQELNYLRLTCISAEKELEGCIYFLLTPLFWITVLLAWLVVRVDPEEITPFVYNIVVLATFAIIIGTGAFLPLACKLLDNSYKVIAMQKLYTKWHLVRKPSRGRRYDYLTAIALRPNVLKYGMYWRLGHDTAIDYFWLLFERIADAILTFQGNHSFKI